MNDLVYLASPYSHPDPAMRDLRFRIACKAAADLMRCGLNIFSPIAHTHPIALAGELPKGWDYWQGYDMAFLTACKRLIVLTIPGWRKSIGVQAEIGIMIAQQKPIDYMRLVNGRCHRHNNHRCSPRPMGPRKERKHEQTTNRTATGSS